MKSVTAVFYEVGIRYDQTQADGTTKKVTDRYVVDAMSFTEAESRAIQVVSDCIGGDYSIKTENKANYTEAVFSDVKTALKWFKVSVVFITINEKTQKEKRSRQNYLVQGTNIMEALKNTQELFRGTMVDYDIVSVTETKIVDVMIYGNSPYNVAEEHKDENNEGATA